MPTLDKQTTSALVKFLYIGDSGTGKTGSLVSLLKAGYELRILDMENGLAAFVAYAKRENLDLTKVEYVPITEKLTMSAMGPVVSGTPKAFVDAIKFMQKWEDGSDPATWGPKKILVLDSGTAFGSAALAWAQGMAPGTKDPRQWYATAQKAFDSTMALLTSEAFQTNVIVISHVGYSDLPNGLRRGYPTTVGTKLGTTISRHFNNLVLATSVGSGTSVKRTIKTVPTPEVDLKNSKPFQLGAELPLETGLATIFETLKG